MTRSILSSGVVLVFAFTLAGCTTAPSGPTGIQHVIVIGVDGMSPDGIHNADTPTMDYLMANGASTMQARAVLPTSSSSNWASMIMGADTEQHGITSNGWERESHVLPAVVHGEEDIFPTIFSVIDEQIADAEVGSIYHWGGFGRLYEKSAVDYDVNGSSEAETADLAARYMLDQKPTFTFIHLDHVDGVGHGEGHGTPAYYASVARADSLIGVILDATREGGIHDNMVLIISSDHGGIGYGHGGETLAEIEIPFLVYGKGVKADYTIRHPVYTYDNAATVAFVLGLETPYAWIGRPVKSAFAGFPEPPQLMARTFLPEPTIAPERQSYAPPGGLFIDEQPTASISTTVAAGVIHYTLDGSDPTTSSPRYDGPFSITESGVLKARVINASEEASRLAQGFFRLVESGQGHGVRYAYYQGSPDEEWEYLPVFAQRRPSRTGEVYEFRIDRLETGDGPYGIVFTSYLDVDTPGDYTFFTLSDDGSKLFIGDREVVNNDGNHGTIERSGSITLEAGRHPIMVQYFQGGGGQWLDVYYSGPNTPRQIIPADRLFLQAE